MWLNTEIQLSADMDITTNEPSIDVIVKQSDLFVESTDYLF